MPAASTGQKLGFAAALLVLTVLLSRVLGFLRDAVIAALFGATGATDAFYAAFTIPDFLNYIVAGGTLSITFIPIYTRHLEQNDEAGGNRIVSIIATVMTIVVVVGIVASSTRRPRSPRATCASCARRTWSSPSRSRASFCPRSSSSTWAGSRRRRCSRAVASSPRRWRPCSTTSAPSPAARSSGGATASLRWPGARSPALPSGRSGHVRGRLARGHALPTVAGAAPSRVPRVAARDHPAHARRVAGDGGRLVHPLLRRRRRRRHLLPQLRAQAGAGAHCRRRPSGRPGLDAVLRAVLGEGEREDLGELVTSLGALVGRDRGAGRVRAHRRSPARRRSVVPPRPLRSRRRWHRRRTT